MMSGSDGPGSPMRKASTDDQVVTLSMMEIDPRQPTMIETGSIPEIVPVQLPPQQTAQQPQMEPTPTSVTVPPPTTQPQPVATTTKTVTPTPEQPKAALPKPTRAPTLPTNWFFKHSSGKWSPFSLLDSSALELAFKSPTDDNANVTTDGGRYRVNLATRARQSIYWSEKYCDVRRASWYVGHDDLFPFSEEDANAIEKLFAASWMSQEWKVKATLPNSDVIELRNENFFVLFPGTTSQYGLENPEYNSDGKIPPRMLKRGYPNQVAVGEDVDNKFDHCVLVLPGAMAERPYLSDLGFTKAEARRGTFIDCVDTMRIKSQTLLASNFEATDNSRSSGKMEFLPITWADDEANRETVRDAETLMLGTQQNLRRVLSKELLDSLCYYAEAQSAVNSIVQEMNQVVQLFKERNPTFRGSFHVVGYGLGACYLHDIMSSQGNSHVTPPTTATTAPTEPTPTQPQEESVDVDMEDSADENDVDGVVPSVAEITWQQVLKNLELGDFIETLEKEEVDMDTLKECADADYKEMGFNLGQRKKVIKAIKTQGEEQEKQLEELKSQRASAKAEKTAKRNERRLERRLKAAIEAERSLSDAQLKLESSAKEQASRARNIASPTLEFEPKTVFFMGAPIGLFISLQPTHARTINANTKYDSCGRVFNVFHPYDPIAYRLEPLVESQAVEFNPVQVEHHAGSKKLHLELRDYVKETSKDLKKEVSKWAGNAWGAFMTKMGNAEDGTAPSPPLAVDTLPPPVAQQLAAPPMGKLNSSKRIDHVLQEDFLEKINEAMVSMGPHSSYWTSNDATFFIINKVYMVGR